MADKKLKSAKETREQNGWQEADPNYLHQDVQIRLTLNGTPGSGTNNTDKPITREKTEIATGRQSRKDASTQSPRRGLSPAKSPNRSDSPGKSPRRGDSPFKSPRRSQWEVVNPASEECLQEYNIRQMTFLYGQQLGGRVDDALDWYREQAIQAASAPTSSTPRSTQTYPMSPFSTGDDYKRFVGSPYKNTEMKAREMLKAEKNVNKLSTRRRVQKTPNVDDIRAREERFRNDAIKTERRRTRFKDIIPQYDASSDKHCKAYFKRRDVKDLISVTCSRETTPAGSCTPGTTPRPTPGATPF